MSKPLWQPAFNAWNSTGFALHDRARQALDTLTGAVPLEHCLPAPDAIFRAFEFVRPSDVRVVILGQDPYPNPEDAMGLAFSSPAPKLPASLRNIFKELEADTGVPPRPTGDLSHWSRQGVLLANTALTVGRDGGSHFVHWATFTRSWIEALASDHPLVWILWGKHAQGWKASIQSSTLPHAIIESPHPSPLSAHRGFFGSRPFSQANQALAEMGHATIDW